MADENIVLDISKLKVPDLKKELKSRGLSTTGNKGELMERLQSVLKMNEGISTDSVDDLDEELLNDDDDEHLETNESVISDLDCVLEETPDQKLLKRKLSESSIDVKTGPPKKVILNRNTPSIAHESSTRSSTEVNESTSKEDDSNEKKVIKFSDLSAKERLEMRAKKFGVSLTDDAKKSARVERFTSSSNASSIKTPVDTSIDVLKQRAERFGGSVSNIMSNLENKEKLEKRKARFGEVAANNGSNGVVTSDSDKAKQRLERFKQPVK